jgi:LysM repeat protein
LLAAVALAAYLVKPGDTLSVIAANHGVSLAAAEAANPQIANPAVIYVGQTVKIPGSLSAARAHRPSGAHRPSNAHRPSDAHQPSDAHRPSGAHRPSSRHSHAPARKSTPPAPRAATQTSSTASGFSSSSLSDIPGVPQSFAACVAYRESTDLRNPAANGNAYGIIPASGYNVYGTSLANQKQVFAKLYQQYGTSPWAADGC